MTLSATVCICVCTAGKQKQTSHTISNTVRALTQQSMEIQPRVHVTDAAEIKQVS